MTAYNQRIIEECLSDMDHAASSVARGRALERLVAYIFSECDGVRHHRNNVINAPASSEVDVCFWNARHGGYLDFLPNIIVAECKNVATRVGSDDIRNFFTKVREMHLDHGVFVAAQGITGTQKNLRAAHDTVRTAFQRDHVRLLIVTRAEICELQSPVDLVKLLQNKILDLTVGAPSFAD